jgi:hypothetical protein
MGDGRRDPRSLSPPERLPRRRDERLDPGLGVTVTIALFAIASGRSLDGVVLRHAASGIALGYSVTPLSAWFLMVLGLIAALAYVLVLAVILLWWLGGST